ncbi:unnamed protein product [Paramecium sonneborni]|uniref:Transmembrane protein n=1 Tax=Paramecium sonneborni TaxID=65129 RepID=A0A8S1L1N7_9CILI|nr:unnamed protein product [Paramecium sonneborni]
MNNILKKRLFTTPEQSQQKQDQEEELPNPMVDSFFSQKSQNTLKSNSSPPKNIKLILKSDKKPFFVKPQQYQLLRNVQDNQTKLEKKYDQLDCLIPSIKLIQVNEKQHQSECFNGEEAIIDYKIYFNQCHEIRNIYYMTAIGYKLGIEEVQETQEIQMQNSIPVSERMSISLRAKQQFQKAKNKIKKINLVSEISKEDPDEEKRLKKDRENSDHINQLLNDPTNIIKNEHLLGELIGQTKVVNTYQNQENNQINQEPKNIEQKKQKVNIFINKSLITHLMSSLVVFVLIVISAYIKTTKGFKIQVEDL